MLTGLLDSLNPAREAELRSFLERRETESNDITLQLTPDPLFTGSKPSSWKLFCRSTKRQLHYSRMGLASKLQAAGGQPPPVQQQPGMQQQSEKL